MLYGEGNLARKWRRPLEADSNLRLTATKKPGPSFLYCEQIKFPKTWVSSEVNSVPVKLPDENWAQAAIRYSAIENKYLEYLRKYGNNIFFEIQVKSIAL